MARLSPFVTLLTAAATVLGARIAGPAATGPAISISGTQLALDGKETFLPGVSLFDALGSTPPRDEDLNALRQWGIRVVRVWAHWSAPLYDRDGSLSAGGRSRLAALISRLRSRGLVLELVLLRPGQLPGQKYAAFESPEARIRAVTALARALIADRDVLFDLFNEHDHPDGPISHADARRLRDAMKAVDPKRIVTISSTATHLIAPGGIVGRGEEQNLREEAGRGPGDVAVDILAPHLPRTGDWAATTASRVATLRAVLERVATPMPIYLSEENRTFAGRAIAPEMYLRAAAGARAARAAGWMFHTEAGFALGARSFLGALAPNERTALEQLSDKIRAIQPK
jgi:hypothetical protein